MSTTESPARFRVRVRAAQLRIEMDRKLGRPSPDWIIALVKEGERREHQAREATSH
jgi:hypothetical protein